MTAPPLRSPPVDAAAVPSSHLAVAVRRVFGTVVVTVRGQVGVQGCQLLEDMLTDLIDGQGNLSVAVDLGEATVEPEAYWVFFAAAHRAHRHRAKLMLREPPAETHAALQSGGLADLLEIVPRRASGE